MTRKVVLLALLAGTWALAALPQTLVKPIWISALPERPGRVYAMGLAPVTTGDAQAVTQASQNARAEVLSRLRANVQSETSVRSTAKVSVQAGGADPALRGQVRAARLAVDRQMEQLRGSLTFSLEPGARGAVQVASLLRNAALKAGLGWSETGGEFVLALAFQTDSKEARIDVNRQDWNGWWRGGAVSHSVNQGTGIIVARGILELTLKDKAGNQYESVEVEAKGLGVSDFQAEQRLKEDIRTKLEKTFAKWLENLVGNG